MQTVTRADRKTAAAKAKRFGAVGVLATVALVALAAVACGGDDHDKRSDAGFTDAGYKTAGLDAARIVTIDGDIVIGISSALTGELAGLGIPIADSAEAAGDGVSIKNHKLRFVREDDLCSPEGGAAAAGRLVEANVVATIGPVCPDGTRASLQVFDNAGISHISPAASAGNLTAPTRPEGPFVTFFRLPVTNADEAREQAKFAADVLKARKAFVVFASDGDSSELAKEFEKSFKEEGGSLVGTPFGFEPKTTDFKSIIAAIKMARPDLIYQAGSSTEAAAFLQQLRAETDLQAIPYIGGDAMKDTELLSGARDAANGAYLTTRGTTGSQFQIYKKKYADKFNGTAETAKFGPEAYDAATAIIKALEKVAVDKNGKLEVDLKKLNEEIKKSNFEGASGKVEFLQNGDRADAVVRVFKVVAGKYVQLEAGKK